MEGAKSVLVIEDEKGIRNFISSSLMGAGYQVLIAETGTAARQVFLNGCPDVVLLDLGLPDADGLDLIREFNNWRHVPIIIVSARDREMEKVKALDLGADDYITKPFGISELIARIRTAIRHHERNVLTIEQDVIQVKDLVIDLGKHMVTQGGTEIHFTGIEFKSLALLAKHAGKVLTYETIIKEIWGGTGKNGNQTLRVNMTNIRRKLGEDPAAPKYIMTELGIGYRMLEDD